MHPNKKQQCSTTDGGHVLAVAFPSGTARPILLTVQQFSSRNPAFSPLSIRSLIFKAGERLGTLLTPERGRLAARKQWLAGHLQMRGTLTLDAGAVRALLEQRKSLLPVGVTSVQGSFRRGEMVACIGPDGREVARGLVNYSAADAQRIIGLGTEAIEQALGYVDEPELVHRDNLVLV